jgi:hypothetical protein
MKYSFFALLFPMFLLPSALSARDLYVSLEGNDTWSGSLSAPNPEGSDGPFRTLERARDSLRSGGVPAEGTRTVWIRGGEYELSQTFGLASEDSGTETSPIHYRAQPGEEVFLVGGMSVRGWKGVEDPETLARLPEESRAQVKVLSLRDLGIEDYGQLTARGFGQPVYPAGLELFCDGKPMTLARWPNEGWTHIAEIPAGTDGGKFVYEGDRPARWTQAEDVWIHGYWTWDWADSYVSVAAIHPESREIVTREPHGVYGYKPERRYYALNLIEELDAPGEWYLDRSSGNLYFWEPSDLETAKTQVSLLPTLIQLESVSHVRFEGLTLEVTRATAIDVRGGDHVTFAGCVIRNTGNEAVSLNGGTHHKVISCDIYHNGDGGISLNGGDRLTLTPGYHSALNNHIMDYSRWSRTYRPAVMVSGVGNHVANNHIHDAPHTGIQLGGNEHVIEYNHIHDVCQETGDVGAFYMGRDWTQRGVRVRYNFFHHIGGFTAEGRFTDAQSVYLDDWTSGIEVVGNVIYKGGRGVLIGGGRDNLVENNILVDCNPAIHVDSRGLGWASYYFDGSTTTLEDRLEAMNYREPPYSEKYPELLTLYDDEPAVAKGNVIVRNVIAGEGQDLALMNGLTTEIVKYEDNFTEGDPMFVDPENLDFRIEEDSPVWKTGFKPLPYDRMGTTEDSLRKQLPKSSRLD